MFETIKDFINTGRYELKELTEKINALWIESSITDGPDVLPQMWQEVTEE